MPRKIVLASHSSREFFEARADINYLEGRFPHERLSNLPPFGQLKSLDEQLQLSGALTAWEVIEAASGPRLVPIWHYDPPYKIQSAAFCGDQLAVLCADRLIVLGPDLRERQSITDPWLVGGHMVWPAGPDSVWVNSAPANALLRVSLTEGRVLDRRLVPGRYGRGYELAPTDDLKTHYVPTDLQPTHVNCVMPTPKGLLLTLWIPGVVGYLLDDDPTRRIRERLLMGLRRGLSILRGDEGFHELTAGLRGCHGARLLADEGLVMVTDSPAGLIWFLDADTGEVRHRLKVESRWLHDACLHDAERIVATRSDANSLALISRRTGEILANVDCRPYGRSTAFVMTAELPAAWESSFPLASDVHQASLGETLILEPANRVDTQVASSLFKHVVKPIHAALAVDASAKSELETLAVSDGLALERGTYVFGGRIDCSRGFITLGLADALMDEWFVQLPFNPDLSKQQEKITFAQPMRVRACLTAAHSDVSAVLRDVYLRKVVPERQEAEPARRLRLAAEIRESFRNCVLKRVRWAPNDPNPAGIGFARIVESGVARQGEFLAGGCPFGVVPGRYRITIEFKREVGGVSFGLLDVDGGSWFWQFAPIDDAPIVADLSVDAAFALQPIISAHNFPDSGLSRIRLKRFAVERLEPDTPPSGGHKPQADETFEIGRGVAVAVTYGHAELPQRPPVFSFWAPLTERADAYMRVETKKPVKSAYLFWSEPFLLKAGRYRLYVDLESWDTSPSFAILNFDTGSFLVEIPFPGPIVVHDRTIDIPEDVVVRCVVSAVSAFEERRCSVKVRAVHLNPAEPSSHPIAEAPSIGARMKALP